MGPAGSTAAIIAAPWPFWPWPWNTAFCRFISAARSRRKRAAGIRRGRSSNNPSPGGAAVGSQGLTPLATDCRPAGALLPGLTPEGIHIPANRPLDALQAGVHRAGGRLLIALQV